MRQAFRDCSPCAATASAGDCRPAGRAQHRPPPRAVCRRRLDRRAGAVVGCARTLAAADPARTGGPARRRQPWKPPEPGRSRGAAAAANRGAKRGADGGRRAPRLGGDRGTRWVDNVLGGLSATAARRLRSADGNAIVQFLLLQSSISRNRNRGGHRRSVTDHRRTGPTAEPRRNMPGGRNGGAAAAPA